MNDWEPNPHRLWASRGCHF